MILVRLQAGLGNQMFGYAAALSLAKKNGTFFVYYDTRRSLEHSFRLQRPKWINDTLRLATLPLRKSNLLKPYKPSYEHLGGDLWREIYSPGFFERGKWTYLDGWFQSPCYSAGARQDLLDAFTPHKHYLERIKTLEASFKHPPETRCAIHVRRGDYLTSGGAHASPGLGWALPRSYYDTALGLLPHGLEYIFVSDDPAWVRDQFKSLNPSLVSTGEQPVVDMCLISRCRYNVIANSTFSWWGAWLNNDPGRKIYCPEYFLGWNTGHWIPGQIEVPGWINIPVRA